MELKDWVRAARKHKHWTQTQLGEKLHVTKGNVSAWENGHHEPSFGQLQVIAEQTGYPLMQHDLKASSGDQQLAPWPFPDIDQQRFNALTPTQRIEIQGIVRQRIEAFEHAGNGGNGRPGDSPGKRAAGGE